MLLLGHVIKLLGHVIKLLGHVIKLLGHVITIFIAKISFGANFGF